MLRIMDELRSLLDHAETIQAEEGEKATLDGPPAEVLKLGDRVSLETIEREHIRRVLSGALTLDEAASILGINGATLWRRRKKYGIIS